MLTTTAEPLPSCDGLFVSLVSDVLDSIGLTSQVIDSGISPLDRTMRIYGRAATFEVRSADGPPERPYETLLAGIDSAKMGSVLVASCHGGRSDSGLFGGLLATACRSVGVTGAVTDGSVRDVAELLELGFPTFSTGINAADSYGRDEVIRHSSPITLGGVGVEPGDIVFGDVDGVVIVPAESFSEVYRRAHEKLRHEGGMRTALAAGMPLREAFNKFRVL